jgi:hypothetical protein
MTISPSHLPKRRHKRTRRVAPRFDERDRAINQELFDLLATPKDEPASCTANEEAAHLTASPAAREEPPLEHIRTEVKAIPGGGVSIRVFFRLGDCTYIAHSWHSTGTISAEGHRRSASSNCSGSHTSSRDPGCRFPQPHRHTDCFHDADRIANIDSIA